MINITPEYINEQLSKFKKTIFVLGIVLIILGCLAIFYQYYATEITVYIIGIMLIVAGIAQGIYSLRVQGLGLSALWAVLAVLYIIAGIISFKEPTQVATLLTLIVGFVLIMSGVIQFINNIANRHVPNWGWGVFSGIIAFVLGLMVIFSWPFDSKFLLGLFLGINFIFQGWSMVFIGLAAKSTSTSV